MSATVKAEESGAPSVHRAGDYGSAVNDISDTRPLLELPNFNRDSGDLVFDLQGSIGTPETGSESGFYASPLTNHRASAEQSYRARLGDRREVNAWDVGAVFGYQLSEPSQSIPTGSINVQVVTDSADPQAELMLQPGVDYVIPMSQSWQLNARVFSTYAPEERRRSGTGDSHRQQNASAAEREHGWREVGVNVGVGYNVSDSWNIQTQAGLTRTLSDTPDRGTEGDEENVTDFFGGVFLNYQF
ncbi:MAG: hypothetical protein H6905_08055 [Hyphomicrobiales bacterium]|nr:hypothetical protein [Hyphomicrobiales bacterium]